MLKSVREFITNVKRMFHSSGLPNHLDFPDSEFYLWEVGRLERAARLFRETPSAHPLLEMLGPEATRVAADTIAPPVLFFMEDLSRAFDIVEKQCESGVIVSGTDRQRLVFVLATFLSKTGQPIAAEEAESRVDSYVEANSLPDATMGNPTASSVTLRHGLFDALCEFDEEISAASKGRCGLSHVGLILVNPLYDEEVRYQGCTPLNCRVFACTGGDGVHYSFLVEDDSITEDSPVVVTYPEDESSVVASSLKEFLSKGLISGYDEVSDVDVEDEESREILRQLKRQLQLEPIAANHGLDELNQRYRDRLRLPPGAQ